MQEELEALLRLDEFQELLLELDRNARVPLRSVLSHHGTQSCQPGKVESPWTSLGECGLNAVLPAEECTRTATDACRCTMCEAKKKTQPTQPLARKYCVLVEGPGMFAHGDGLEWIYESAPWWDKNAAKHHACLEILAFLLVVGPDAVHLHTNTLVNIDGLRQRARAVRERFLEDVGRRSMHGAEWTCSVVPKDLEARPRPQPLARLSSQFVPLADGESQDARDREVVEFLRASTTPLQWQNPSRAPRPVREFLARRVEKGGLWKLLQRVPGCDLRGPTRGWLYRLPAAPAQVPPPPPPPAAHPQAPEAGEAAHRAKPPPPVLQLPPPPLPPLARPPQGPAPPPGLGSEQWGAPFRLKRQHPAEAACAASGASEPWLPKHPPAGAFWRMGRDELEARPQVGAPVAKRVQFLVGERVAMWYRGAWWEGVVHACSYDTPRYYVDWEYVGWEPVKYYLDGHQAGCWMDGHELCRI